MTVLASAPMKSMLLVITVGLLCLGSVGTEEPPRVVRRQVSHYPDSLANAGFGGVIRIQVIVDTSGAVDVVEHVRAHGMSPAFSPTLERAATEAAYGWRFKPRHPASPAVESRLIIPFRFDPSAPGISAELSVTPSSFNAGDTVLVAAAIGVTDTQEVAISLDCSGATMHSTEDGAFWSGTVAPQNRVHLVGYFVATSLVDEVVVVELGDAIPEVLDRLVVCPADDLSLTVAQPPCR